MFHSLERQNNVFVDGIIYWWGGGGYKKESVHYNYEATENVENGRLNLNFFFLSRCVWV